MAVPDAPGSVMAVLLLLIISQTHTQKNGMPIRENKSRWTISQISAFLWHCSLCSSVRIKSSITIAFLLPIISPYAVRPQVNWTLVVVPLVLRIRWYTSLATQNTKWSED